MRKERANVPVRVLELNSGQLDWLPKNPRQWTQDDVDRTRRSIEEDPDFMDDRPLLVVPKGHKFIVFAGNLRLTACKALDWKGAPVVIYHEESEDDRDTIIRRAMKDNGSFGSWDYDTLANEWGDLPLTDWGVPAWDFQEKRELKEKSTGELNLGDINVSYEIQVSCEDLESQLALIKELDERGYKCKSL